MDDKSVPKAAWVDSGFIDNLLLEDIGSGDVTARIVPESLQASAILITRERMVVCGRDWFDAVFQRLDPDVSLNWRVCDGEEVAADSILCQISGPARSLLTGERTALNLFQTLSGTATRARRYAQAVADSGARVLDTRKTLPGLRQAQKYAVRCGGCYNHRSGLYDAILIKENHILACGSIKQAVRAARVSAPDLPIELEAESLDELEQAIESGVERVLLDNFELTDIRTAVEFTAGRAALEVSGNVTLENIARLAETGVDFISVGDLTKNVEAVDLSLRIDLVLP